MDDRVQQCPNCGTTMPLAARFCVTCGIRLPEPATQPESSGETARSGWAQPSEDVWIGEATALDDESEQTLSRDFPQTGQPAAFGTEPVDRLAGSADGASADGAGESVIALPPADENEPNRSASEEPGAHLPEPADDSEHEISTSGDGAGVEDVGPEGELADLSAEATEPSTESDIHGTPPPEENDAFDLTLESDDFEPAGWDDSGNDSAEMTLTDDQETDEMTASSAERGVGAGQSDTLERANGLLDELRDLLPQIAASATPVGAVIDPVALRDQVATARGDRSVDDFAALREMIADAVSRPRDIDALLRLSQRVDDIAALLEERDRLEAAFNDLITRLESTTTD